jgi:regulator of RNase E activity RraB
MAKANKVFRRIGIEDFFVEVGKEVPNHIQVYDMDGVELTTVNVFTAGYEDENGKECEENGEYLN